MIGALFNGISGLYGNQLALNAESNNIANVNTLSYKADSITFLDALYDTTGGVKVGMGVSTPIVEKNSSQGSFRFTDSAYDMAIDGPGYFLIQDTDGKEVYTRAGNFKIGSDGFLVNANDMVVKGISINTPLVNTTDPNQQVFTNNYNTFIATKNITTPTKIINYNAKSTDYTKSIRDDDISLSGNGYKDVSTKLNDIDALKQDYVAKLGIFTRNYQATYQTGFEKFESNIINKDDIKSDSSISIDVGNVIITQIFDTDVDTTLKKFSDKISAQTGITSRVDLSVDGDDTQAKLYIDSIIPGKDIFVTNLFLDNKNLGINQTSYRVEVPIEQSITDTEESLKLALKRADAEFLSLKSELDLTKAQGVNFEPLQMKLDSLKLTDSPFGNPEVINGALYIRQNDNVFLVGKVATVDFSNEEGLQPLGNNLFAKTKASGEPQATNSSITKIVSNALELSNSDLSTSLTALMIYQRAFEANAKSVTTADSFLNTAIQLKKG